jgi:hypothetical protein
MTLILEKKYSKLIFYNSFNLLIISMIGLYNNYYLNTLSIFSVFLTSINYWRYPIKGFRRNIDIMMVGLSIAYNSYYVYDCAYGHYYISMIILGIMIYIFSGLLYTKKYLGLSTLLHCKVHLLSNIANYLLFTNNICYD